MYQCSEQRVPKSPCQMVIDCVFWNVSVFTVLFPKILLRELHYKLYQILESYVHLHRVACY
jgi:hypothetical protein